MLTKEFQDLISQHPTTPLLFILPDGKTVPEHFHVTEVGRVQKEFIDCGGTPRSVASCVLQLWVAEDVEHRLHAGKLSRIVDLASKLGLLNLPIEVEYQTQSVTVYSVGSLKFVEDRIEVQLEAKHTACLALELCVIPNADGCCTDKKCC